MKTQIFKSLKSFLEREDKTVNEVSPEFALKCPDYEKDNETNKGCWNCRQCASCDSCAFCDYCTSCDTCFNCKDCVNVKGGVGLTGVKFDTLTQV